MLLKGSITLPSNCIGAGVVTIEELLNVLAEKILVNNTKSDSDHHIQEVMTIFPTLQFGMDVNPTFTNGPTGTEYTLGLNAFDLLHIELVHGWLIDPQAEEYELIEGKTYNQLVTLVTEGNDASAEIDRNPMMMENRHELTIKANEGRFIHNFLEQSGHQLTQYGLTTLHEYLQDGQMAVFFRNNHFNTLTKHEGLLYLLVTDIGYASVGNIVWEKLDVIDGDTEYVGENFQAPAAMKHHEVSSAASGEQLVANNKQSEADRMLAMQLSQETGPNRTLPPQTDADMEAARQASLKDDKTTTTKPETIPETSQSVAVGVPTNMTDEERDHMIALQLQKQQEREAAARAPATVSSAEERDRMMAMQLSSRDGDEASAILARQLHQEELQRQRQLQGPRGRAAPASSSSSGSDCIIS